MILKDRHNGFILFGVKFYNYGLDPHGLLKADAVYYNGRVKETVKLFTEKSDFIGEYRVPSNLVKTRLQGKGKHCTMIKVEKKPNWSI